LAAKARVSLTFSDGLLEIRWDSDNVPVADLSSLPGARRGPWDRTWRLRAGRRNLTAVAVWLHELGDTVVVTCDQEARRRLERCTAAWITAGAAGIVVAGPYNAVRVRLLRSVPEAVYKPRERCWVVAVTRGSAAALLQTLAAGGWRFQTDDRTRRLLERVREGCPYDELRFDCVPAEPGGRRSPVPHWRHHVRGAVFRANRERREFVEGIGWCVRVRVDPAGIADHR
jgi:hypothetical protein